MTATDVSDATSLRNSSASPGLSSIRHLAGMRRLTWPVEEVIELSARRADLVFAPKDPGDVPERLAHLHAVVIDDVLRCPVVPRAAHLQHGQAAAHLALQLDVPQQDDRVGDGRDVSR
ncbi:MAG: hypothetical protein R3F59_33625 [Myxococcota bacterium]